MFFFCWYFDFLCKFKISNGSWCIDKTSFYCILPVFSAVKWRITDKNRQMHVKCMQNMSVSSWIENIEAKNFIRFQLLKFMIHLARVANFMVIFSASYVQMEILPCFLQDIGPYGCCLALNPFLHLVTPSRALGTADHVRSLDDLFPLFLGSGHEGDEVL